MLDFSNNDGPVVQSRPSSVYEKKYARNPTRNEYSCSSNKVEPIYEPILPPVPPPLPKKPWESIKEPKLEESACEVDKCKKDTHIFIHRGPAPLQRSPVIDNVALKAINEERDLKAKEDSISDDIVDQLALISILTQQHMSEQGLISTNQTDNETKSEVKSKDSSTEELHTLKYKAQTLNTSNTHYDKKQSVDSSGANLQNEAQNKNNASSAAANNTHIHNIPDSDAQAQIKHVHINETLHSYTQEQELQPMLIDTYTKISKSTPKSNVSSETSHFSSARIVVSDGKEKEDATSDALKVLSSDGEGLPYIDESKGCDSSFNTNIVTDGSTAYGIKEKRILASVEEENAKCDQLKAYKEPVSGIDEIALDAAIIEAAGLENTELVVERIQLQNPTNIDCEDRTKELNQCENLNPASSSIATTVSTLLVSERTCSGTESVQISEKLISREN